MHPNMLNELAHERCTRLRQELHPPPRPVRVRPVGNRRRVRERFGWTLVEVGLRLTVR